MSAITKEQNLQAIGDTTTITLYHQMLLDTIATNVNACNPTAADNIVLRHVENKLAELLEFLNQH